MPAKKFALKIVGEMLHKEDEILDAICRFVRPGMIDALVKDHYNEFFTLFMKSITAVCSLVGKTLELSRGSMQILPLYDWFVVENVYPDVTDENLMDIFKHFGRVVSVQNYHVLPNSAKFGHILSGRRELSFLLTGNLHKISIPINVLQPPHAFHVKRICPACHTEGHHLMNCPDIEDRASVSGTDESEDELSFVIKEELDIFDEAPESQQEVHQAAGPSSGRTRKSSSSSAATSAVSSFGVSMETKGLPALRKVQPGNVDNALASPLVNSTAPEEPPTLTVAQQAEKVPGQKLTKVVSSSFTGSGQHRVMKRTFSTEAEELIEQSKGVLDPHMLRSLLLIDCRNWKAVIDFARTCTDDFSAILRQLRRLKHSCSKKGPDFLRRNHTFVSKVVSVRRLFLKETGHAWLPIGHSGSNRELLRNTRGTVPFVRDVKTEVYITVKDAQ